MKKLVKVVEKKYKNKDYSNETENKYKKYIITLFVVVAFLTLIGKGSLTNIIVNASIPLGMGILITGSVQRFFQDITNGKLEKYFLNINVNEKQYSISVFVITVTVVGFLIKKFVV